MAKIKIKDLPKDVKISKEEMKAIRGGFQPQPEPPGILLSGRSSRDSKLYANLYKMAEPLLATGGE